MKFSFNLGGASRASILFLCILVYAPPRAHADPGVYADRIVFGQAAALTGPAAALGRSMKYGISAAFEEANRAGGIKGRKIHLISRDDGYEPEQSIAVTRTLIEDDHAFALVGAVGTPTAMAALPLANRAHLPFIGTFSGAEFLRASAGPNVINVRASYGQEIDVLVDWLNGDRKAKKIAVLYQDDAFGRSVLHALKATLAARGLPLAAESTFVRNTTAVKRGLLEIRRAQPDAIILVGPPAPCAAFISQAKSLGLEAEFASVSFAGGLALAKLLGADGAGVHLTQVVPAVDDERPVVQRFRKAMEFVDASESPSVVALEGYIVGRLITAALERIGGAPTRDALRRAFAESRYEIDDIELVFENGRNQGSDVVYLTRLRGDGSIEHVATSKSEPIELESRHRTAGAP